MRRNGNINLTNLKSFSKRRSKQLKAIIFKSSFQALVFFPFLVLRYEGDLSNATRLNFILAELLLLDEGDFGPRGVDLPHVQIFVLFDSFIKLSRRKALNMRINMLINDK